MCASLKCHDMFMPPNGRRTEKRERLVLYYNVIQLNYVSILFLFDSLELNRHVSYTICSRNLCNKPIERGIRLKLSAVLFCIALHTVDTSNTILTQFKRVALESAIQSSRSLYFYRFFSLGCQSNLLCISVESFYQK